MFDVDAIGLVNILNRLNHGLDIAGNPIGAPTGFFTGVGANPGAINLDQEIKRLEWKIEAGAEFIITQPVFDLRILENFMEKTEHIKKPLIAGLWPLTSIRNAEFMNNEVPGASVPEKLFDRLRKEQTKEGAKNTGIEIAKETINEIRSSISGIQASMPFGKIEYPLRILEDVLKNI